MGLRPIPLGRNLGLNQRNPAENSAGFLLRMYSIRSDINACGGSRGSRRYLWLKNACLVRKVPGHATGRRGSSIRRDGPEPPSEDKAIKAIVDATMIHSYTSMPTFISMEASFELPGEPLPGTHRSRANRNGSNNASLARRRPRGHPPRCRPEIPPGMSHHRRKSAPAQQRRRGVLRSCRRGQRRTSA